MPPKKSLKLNSKKVEPFDWQSLQAKAVIGVDEVGRGCLAGPVYAAAVILDPQFLSKDIRDSKTISEARREEIADFIQTHHRVSIAWASEEEIFKLNILHASLLAMKRAVAGLQIESGHILVDGTFTIPQMGSNFLQTPLVKGDSRAMPIAAASIVAKVARDRRMKELAGQYPQYGFELHKGYATPIHQEAIRQWGPCPEHRRAFAGVREFLRTAESAGDCSKPQRTLF